MVVKSECTVCPSHVVRCGHLPDGRVLTMTDCGTGMPQRPDCPDHFEYAPNQFGVFIVPSDFWYPCTCGLLVGKASAAVVRFICATDSRPEADAAFDQVEEELLHEMKEVE